MKRIAWGVAALASALLLSGAAPAAMSLALARDGDKGRDAIADPAGWAMMITGFFGAGAVFRARRGELAAYSRAE